MRRLAIGCVLLSMSGYAHAQNPLTDYFQLFRPELSISVFRDFSTTPTAHACTTGNVYFGSAFLCETIDTIYKPIGSGTDATGVFYQILLNQEPGVGGTDVVRGTNDSTEVIARLPPIGGSILNLSLDSTNGR